MLLSDDQKNAITVDNLDDIAEADHILDDLGLDTIETMVADLVKGIVYVYFFYQYDRPLVLNVRQRLANPREPRPLSMLFPHDVRDEAARR